MGIAFGVAAAGRHGEVVINNLVNLEVPAVVKNSVKKAVSASKKAGAATANGIGSGAKWAAKKAKAELSNAGAELSQFGVVDLDSQIKPDERSMIVDFLRDSARIKSGKHEYSDAPDINGHTKIGGGASNGNVNAALKLMGGGAFLPTGGGTGVYLYLDNDTNKVSGFAATIKWTLD